MREHRIVTWARTAEMVEGNIGKACSSTQSSRQAPILVGTVPVSTVPMVPMVQPLHVHQPQLGGSAHRSPAESGMRQDAAGGRGHNSQRQSPREVCTGASAAVVPLGGCVPTPGIPLLAGPPENASVPLFASLLSQVAGMCEIILSRVVICIDVYCTPFLRRQTSSRSDYIFGATLGKGSFAVVKEVMRSLIPDHLQIVLGADFGSRATLMQQEPKHAIRVL